jgi:hypothetical protein
MRNKITIERRIELNKEKIKKFRSENSPLLKERKKRAIFTLQEINRVLKWVIK